MPRSDELTLIERFFRPLAGEGAFGLSDDAARLVPKSGYDQVITSDMIASGVHFLPDDPPDSIARKALRVNLSDLASKGADPFGYSLNIALGPEVNDGWIASFAAGLSDDQNRYGITMLGGDTISADTTLISITVIGLVPGGKMVHRFTAQPGDHLYVSGAIGAATAGLNLLTDPQSVFQQLASETRDSCISRYRVPVPRTELVPAIRSFARAAMDVSDGLIGDADKMAAASGCTGKIIFEDIPLAAGLDDRAFQSAAESLITGGDDYEILAGIPPENAIAFERAAADVKIPVCRIGWLAEGHLPVQVMRDGREMVLGRRAYVHTSRMDRLP